MRLKEGVVENLMTDGQHAEGVVVAEGMSSESDWLTGWLRL